MKMKSLTKLSSILAIVSLLGLLLPLSRAQANPALTLPYHAALQGWKLAPKSLGVGLGALVVVAGTTYKTLFAQPSLLDLEESSLQPLFSPVFSEALGKTNPAVQVTSIFLNVLRPLLDNYEQQQILSEINIKNSGPEFEKKVIADIEQVEDQENFFGLHGNLVAHKLAEQNKNIHDDPELYNAIFKEIAEKYEVMLQRLQTMRWRQEVYQKTQSRSRWEALVNDSIKARRVGSQAIYHLNIKGRGVEHEQELLTDLNRLTQELEQGSALNHDGYISLELLEEHPETREAMSGGVLPQAPLFKEDILSIKKQLQKRQEAYQKSGSLQEWEKSVEKYVDRLLREYEALSLKPTELE